jgi:organic anion transporter 4A
LGIQWIVVRVLGTIPAPMIFGRLIDESCILWQQESCRTGSGACLLYDNRNMAKYMLLLAVVGKLCSVIFFFFSWFYYIPPKVGVIHDNETDNKTSEKYVKNDVEKY